MHKSQLLPIATRLLSLPLVSAADDISLKRITTLPAGSEVTGLSTNADDDLFLNAQHPGRKNTLKDEARAALVGYIAVFDSRQPSMSIPPEDRHAGVSTTSGEYVTFRKAGGELGNGQMSGGVYDVKGEVMYGSNTPDFNGFEPTGEDTAYLYTGWEGAGLDVSKTSLKRSDGIWSADLSISKMLDFQSVDGGLIGENAGSKA